MIQKYYKKVPEQEIHKELKEKYENFCDTIIHIDSDEGLKLIESK